MMIPSLLMNIKYNEANTFIQFPSRSFNPVVTHKLINP